MKAILKGDRFVMDSALVAHSGKSEAELRIGQKVTGGCVKLGDQVVINATGPCTP